MAENDGWRFERGTGRRSRLWLALLGSAVGLVLWAGCSHRSRLGRDAGPGGLRDASARDAGLGGFLDSGPLRDTGPGDPLCATAAAEWIYLVDSDDVFLRYDPRTNALEEVGRLACPTTSSPFSMSVDRDARAWVLYQDGRIFHVSTADVSCTATAFAPNQAGFEVFGMGFVADTDGSTEETLFVAGGSLLDIAFGTASLGRVDPAALTLAPIGSLPGWPELTGTGSGELWGFFPDTSPPSVRQLDKGTGTTLQTFPMSELSGGSGLGDTAWAFAFWGGRFFVFYKGDLDATTNIWRLDPRDGSVLQVRPNIGYRIVGAGVSTCAPVELI